ncbi:DNA-binding IclR family transcriptional regulator [Paraburkholderia sp. MM5477-R1]
MADSPHASRYHPELNPMNRIETAAKMAKEEQTGVGRRQAKPRAAVYERVRESAALGHAVSEASFERGISVVSAPVRDLSGKIAAALTVTIPRSDIGETAEREPLIIAVCQAALELSERLSYRPRQDDPTAMQARRRSVAAH